VRRLYWPVADGDGGVAITIAEDQCLCPQFRAVKSASFEDVIWEPYSSSVCGWVIVTPSSERNPPV
jgi:hypothetical protein